MTFDGSGEYKNADTAFLEAELAGGNHPLALAGKAIRLGNGRRLREARSAAEEAVRLGPHLWETHFALGFVMEELASMGILPAGPTREQAIASMRKSLELSPRQAEVWYWFSLALLRSGSADQRTEALCAVNHAVALEPRNGNRYTGRGLIRLDMGDRAGGMADFQKARNLNASRALVLNVDAMMAAKRGDYATAFRLQGEIIQSGQSFPPQVGNWLALGFSLRRDKEIRDQYDRWCRDNPEYPEVYVLRAQLKARDGDYVGALTEDQAGLKIAPFHRKLRFQKADHLAARRDWAGALKAADAVLEVSTNDFAAQTIRVRCLAELGRGAEAKGATKRLAERFFHPVAGNRRTSPQPGGPPAEIASARVRPDPPGKVTPIVLRFCCIFPVAELARVPAESLARSLATSATGISISCPSPMEKPVSRKLGEYLPTLAYPPPRRQCFGGLPLQ